jgi:hypothetical protein
MKFAVGILMGILVCYYGRGQDQYKNYCNARFIFCIDYPADFIGEGEAGNGDGQIFSSKNHGVEIRAFGSNAQESSLAYEYRLCKKNIRLTYTLFRPSYFILSGVDPMGRIVYQKTVRRRISNEIQGKNCPVFQTLMITYVAADSTRYKNYCRRIAKSL